MASGINVYSFVQISEIVILNLMDIQNNYFGYPKYFGYLKFFLDI